MKVWIIIFRAMSVYNKRVLNLVGHTRTLGQRSVAFVHLASLWPRQYVEFVGDRQRCRTVKLEFVFLLSYLLVLWWYHPRVWSDVTSHRFDKAMWLKQKLFLARAQRVTSIPTRQIIDQVVHFMTELIPVCWDLEKGCRRSELPACLSLVQHSWATEKW